MSITEYLAEVAQRAANATPGPWREGTENIWQDDLLICIAETRRRASMKSGERHIISKTDALDNLQHDAAFIAAARGDVPKLLKIIAHQAETIDCLSKEHQFISMNALRDYVAERQRELDSIVNEP